jgi:niacin transporter
MKTRELTLGALFGAMTLLIILVFSQFLKVSIPPFFTATLLLHVPLFLSMLVSPSAAAMVGLISAVGFMMTPLGPVVALRALMHTVVGYVGGSLVKRGMKFHYVLGITLPIHAFLEAGAVVLVMGLTPDALKYALTVVAIGTALHHTMDSFVAVFLTEVIKKGLGRGIMNTKA